MTFTPSRSTRFPDFITANQFGQRLLSWVGLLAWVVVLSGCDKVSDPSATKAPQAPPPTVTIAQPIRQEVTEWDEFTGRIEAISAVDIRARVSGYLEKINFTAGQHVKKGALLFVIDPKPFQAALNQALAELAQLKTKRVLAQNDLARAENLMKAKAISVEEYDSRQNGLREAQAGMQAAEAKVALARLNLDYTQIRAPIDGRIGREQLTLGNLVNGDNDASLLTTLISTDPVYVTMDADERSVLNYKRQSSKGAGILGKPAELGIADESGFPHKGTLDYIAPQANPNTGTITLRGVFANPDELLSPGFFARVRIRASAPYSAYLLPDSAISSDQTQHYVWVVKSEQQVEYRKVLIGALSGRLRVITEGVTAEDWVVIDGLQKIKPGMPIAPERITLGAEH